MKKKGQNNQKMQSEIQKRADFVKGKLPLHKKKDDKKSPPCYREASDRFERWAGKLKD